MKIAVGKIVSWPIAAWLALPLVVSAQNIASRPGTVDRSIEGVTLLPGPTFLSPAPGAPVTGPTIKIGPPSRDLIAPGRFWSVPTLSRASGTLTLRKSDHREPRAGAPRAQPLPPPDSLRFDSALEEPPKLQLSK